MIEIIIDILIFIVLIITAGIAYIQLKANHDWNRRQLALIEMKKNRAKYRKALKIIDKHLDYNRREESYTLKKITKAIKKNKTKKLYNSIIIILDYFEYLSLGISQKVFDEEVIKASTETSFIKVHKMFKAYIQNLRETRNANKLYFELEKICTKWTTSEEEDRNPTG